MDGLPIGGRDSLVKTKKKQQQQLEHLRETRGSGHEPQRWKPELHQLPERLPPNFELGGGCEFQR